MRKREMAKTIVSNKEKWLLLNEFDRIWLTAYFTFGTCVKVAECLADKGMKCHNSTVRRYVKKAYNNFLQLI